ncbi:MULTISPECIES: hypothetical protein [Pseudomonas]|uniref:hypothetical protein n=1 Tax=Pseudomonas TaxID=286 RepID=UPI00122E5C78|nr:hypothetical protein [Pseudomonas azotoformans]UMY48234.1 hypothetical protein MLC69_23505 [Pseudomonas azotoformans]
MKFYTSNENDPFSKGSFNITNSPIGPFIADKVRMNVNGRLLILSGHKILDSGERAGVTLFYHDKEGTFTDNFSGPYETPWGYYTIGNWSYYTLSGETTHTYLEKPEHATGKFRFITRIDGADVECEGDFNIQQHEDPYP